MRALPRTILGVTPIGVHRVPFEQRILDEFLTYNRRDPDEADGFVRGQVENAVLMEIVVDCAGGAVDLGYLSQSRNRQPNAQVPYMETLLSSDGNAVLSADCPGITLPPGPARFAFFLHEYRDGEPLYAPTGPVALPPITPTPERLAALMQYEWPT